MKVSHEFQDLILWFEFDCSLFTFVLLRLGSVDIKGQATLQGMYFNKRSNIERVQFA